MGYALEVKSIVLIFSIRFRAIQPEKGCKFQEQGEMHFKFVCLDEIIVISTVLSPLINKSK